MSRLGRREPEIYGTTTAAELDAMLLARAAEIGLRLQIFYTHVEGEAIARIYEAADNGIAGILINPAGFLHAGYALRDCLRAVAVPKIEIHMSNIDARGVHSVTAPAVTGMIAGFGIRSYSLALDAIAALVKSPGAAEQARRRTGPQLGRGRQERRPRLRSAPGSDSAVRYLRSLLASRVKLRMTRLSNMSFAPPPG
jgi:3-dehydroquinate dehydratase II